MKKISLGNLYHLTIMLFDLLRHTIHSFLEILRDKILLKIGEKGEQLYGR
jgi:hypothetical protein